MNIEFKINEPITAGQFIDLLKRSTLGELRPVEDRECMQGMISNSNLTVTAWCDGELVGIARCVTDFHYACYPFILPSTNSGDSRQHRNPNGCINIIGFSERGINNF